MSKPLKYERPRLIDLSSTEWEVGSGLCNTGSSPDPQDPNCINGQTACPSCSHGGNPGC